MNRFPILGALGVILFALPMGCRRHDDAALVATTPPVKTVVGLTLTASVADASTGALIPGVTLTVTGRDANLVVDGNGNSLFHPDTQGGYAGPIPSGTTGVFAVPIKPTASTTYPLVLNLVAAAAGYTATSDGVSVPQSAVKTDGSGGLLVPMTLVAIAAPPPTVSAVTATGTASTSGALTAPVSTATPTVTGTVGGATVNLGTATAAIPATTSIYTDSTHTTPLTGALTVALVYNNNQTLNSLLTFPGGFQVNVGPDGTALSSPGAVVSGALVTLTVTDAAGHAAHAFTQPINITATIFGGTNLPGSAPLRKVRAGDTVSIWAYDEVHGAWTVQRDASGAIITGTLAAADANGNFPVSFPTSHLSGFNVGWFQGGSQIANPTLTVRGNQGVPVKLTGQITGAGWAFERYLPADAADPASVTLSAVPVGQAGTISAAINGTGIQTFSLADLGASQTLDITAAVTSYLNTTRFANATVTVAEICSANPSGPAPVNSVPITAVSAGLPVVSATTDLTGTATLSHLQVGRTYTITAVNRGGQANGQVKTATLTVVAGTNVVPQFLYTIDCTGATGTGQ